MNELTWVASKKFLFFCALFFAAIALSVKSGFLYALDNQVYSFFRSYIDTPIYSLAKFFTFFSGEPFSIFIFVFAFVFLIKIKSYNEAFLVSTNFVFSIIAGITLKYILLVHRPVSDIRVISGYSFPSGHAILAISISFTMAVVFFPYIKQTFSKWIMFLMLGIYLLGSLLTRVILGVHWLSDVLGGLLLGVLCMGISLFLHQNYRMQILNYLKNYQL
jgi:undecaprenyl-diphosphatase